MDAIELRQRRADAVEALRRAAGKCAEVGEHELAKRLRREAEVLWGKRNA